MVIYPEDTVVTVGDYIVLTCVGYGIPRPSISWTKNANVLSNTSIYEEVVSERAVTFVYSILEICASWFSDSGTYACIIDNGITGDSKGFELSVTSEGGIVFTHCT